MNLESIVAAAETLPESEAFVAEAVNGYTAYQIAGIANRLLKSLGIDKEYTSQQFYNWAYAGRINGIKAAKGVKVRYTEDEVQAFLARFIKPYLAQVKAAAAAAEIEETEEIDAE